MKFRLDDYIDIDVAYLAGLIIARGTISESNIRQLTIEFPHSSLEVQGTKSSFDQETSITLGLVKIRERLLELLDADITMVKKNNSIDFVVKFLRNNMVWRNILLLTDKVTSYVHHKIPPIFFDPNLPADYKLEFLKGFADVAGNIRHANRYVDGRNRVRLDVLNYPTNWELPVQLCSLLQSVQVPVHLITWGHPNMNREFREHQINVFAKPFLSIGFTFEHKQRLLEEFAEEDEKNHSTFKYKSCPGRRRIRVKKDKDKDEKNAQKLDPRLIGVHANAYWQICKALGCTKEPPPTNQTDFGFEEDVEDN